MNLFDLLINTLPPHVKPLIGGLIGLLPQDAINSLDYAFDLLLSDLANGREHDACEKMKQVFTGLGIELNDYRDVDQHE